MGFSPACSGLLNYSKRSLVRLDSIEHDTDAMLLDSRPPLSISRQSTLEIIFDPLPEKLLDVKGKGNGGVDFVVLDGIYHLPIVNRRCTIYP
jgi:hypothetical protein